MAIKVLVVDDSALIRQLLSEIVNQSEELTLVGAAPDAFVAKKMVIEQKPDVITLDIEMPKVDGLRFLEVLMQSRPTPVVMISTLTQQGADATLRSLELGAVDFIPKPKIGVAEGIEGYRQLIVSKILTASRARLSRPAVKKTATAPLRFSGTEKLLALGASTGGTEAIKHILMQLPTNAPATVVTQHMPPGFTSAFARRLNACCQVKVVEAQGGERLLPGIVYLAPGDRHLKVRRSGADYRTELDDGDRVSGHRPSVDVLFASLAQAAGGNVVAALLTGMGSDGAEGLLTLKQQGAVTVCQDEASSIVFGMPKVAIEKGAADFVCALDDMAERLLESFAQMKAGSRL